MSVPVYVPMPVAFDATVDMPPGGGMGGGMGGAPGGGMGGAPGGGQPPMYNLPPI
jgi:hypothetical protein